MAKSYRCVGRSDYIELCLQCPLETCHESDPRCLIQIEVNRTNREAGEKIVKFKTYARKRPSKKVKEVASAARADSDF